MDLIGGHCIESVGESGFEEGNAEDMGHVVDGEGEDLAFFAAVEDPGHGHFEDLWRAYFDD